jgi:hypothetical protein
MKAAMSERLGIAGIANRPNLRKYVGVCMTCNHWQIDVRSGAISDLGGWLEAMKAIGEAHAAHIGAGPTPHAESLCAGAGGRVKFGEQWVEPPTMKSGKPADGTLALQPLPRWWSAR